MLYRFFFAAGRVLLLLLLEAMHSINLILCVCIPLLKAYIRIEALIIFPLYSIEKLGWMKKKISLRKSDLDEDAFCGSAVFWKLKKKTYYIRGSILLEHCVQFYTIGLWLTQGHQYEHIYTSFVFWWNSWEKKFLNEKSHQGKRGKFRICK